MRRSPMTFSVVSWTDGLAAKVARGALPLSGASSRAWIRRLPRSRSLRRSISEAAQVSRTGCGSSERIESPNHRSSVVQWQPLTDFDWTQGDLAEGLRRYEAGEFFAHEAWENVSLESRGPDKTFISEETVGAERQCFCKGSRSHCSATPFASGCDSLKVTKMSSSLISDRHQ
jgi:hypothetical protein